MSFYSQDSEFSKLTIINMVMLGNLVVSSDKLRSYKESTLKLYNKLLTKIKY